MPYRRPAASSGTAQGIYADYLACPRLAWHRRRGLAPDPPPSDSDLFLMQQARPPRPPGRGPAAIRREFATASESARTETADFAADKVPAGFLSAPSPRLAHGMYGLCAFAGAA
jgi:hypothetical protein